MQQVDFRLEKIKEENIKSDAVAPESEKKQFRTDREEADRKKLIFRWDLFDTEDSYHPMNDDYEEPVVIDEDELDEEVLREMMDEDDREEKNSGKDIQT